MNNAYEKLQKDMDLYFPNLDEPNFNLNDQIYNTSIKNTYFPSYLKVLPNQFSQNLNNKKSILDTLRITKSNKIDDLELPDLNTSNELTLYNNTPIINNNGNKNNLISIASNENAFANPSIIPQNQINKFNNNNNNNKNKNIKQQLPWKLSKLLLGHTGQVTSVTMDPFNSFFVTGSADRTMKIWDLASGKLQLTLSGHIMAIRDMVISSKHPYLFSVSEDKTIKCWDLEKNQVIRDYHGHLSAVYTIDIHPELDIIVTGGRDSSIRVWDIRTRTPIHVLTGHKNSINKVKCQNIEPQIISCSMDSTVKTWDLINGKCLKTLTFHSKSVRAFIINEKDEEIISGSSDGMKKFKLPNCDYLQDLSFWDNYNIIEQGNLIINSMSFNNENVVFAGCDNGKFAFWDWYTGEMFQNDVQIPVPGSLDSENGILCSTFDKSGDRLITGNIDKSVRIWKKDDDENEDEE
jgi:pleiotropic regulator 1